MKKTIKILIFSAICLLTTQLKAQDGYTYTLIDNGAYSFTVAAVPNASASNFSTSVQSYGFTIIVPDGVTISPSSSLGNSAGFTFFNGTDVAMPSIDGYLITETLGSPAALPAPSSGTMSPMVTFQVNGSPMSGIIYILENDSPLANSVTPLKSFMQADMIDNGMAEFVNVVDPNAAAVSGTSMIDFATLAVEENVLNEFQVSIFPNPATNQISISDLNQSETVEIYNIAGQKILETEANANNNSISISQFSNGLYFLKIKDTTLKFIKE